MTVRPYFWRASRPVVPFTTGTSGAPTVGTHAEGEILRSSTNALWICTEAGRPGTWTEINSGGGNGEGGSGDGGITWTKVLDQNGSVFLGAPFGDGHWRCDDFSMFSDGTVVTTSGLSGDGMHVAWFDDGSTHPGVLTAYEMEWSITDLGDGIVEDGGTGEHQHRIGLGFLAADNSVQRLSVTLNLGGDPTVLFNASPRRVSTSGSTDSDPIDPSDDVAAFSLPTAVIDPAAIGDWHKTRVLTNGSTWAVWSDEVFGGVAELGPKPGGLFFALFASNIGASFRNINAWTADFGLPS